MPEVVCKDIYGKEYKVDSEKVFFRPSVYGILIKDNKVLLVKQFGDGYDFPGGGIDKHETVIDGLKREFWEETGFKVKEEELVDCQSAFLSPTKGIIEETIVILF